MQEKIFKITKIDDEFINLYINCFKEDKIFNERMKGMINNKELIIQIFEYYLKYGTIIGMKTNNKLISFLSAFDVKKLYKDQKAFNIIYNKKLFSEIYDFLNKKEFTCNYIVLLGVDKSFRNRGIGTKLIEYYITHYKYHDIIVSDIDNKYSYRIFEKLGFNNQKIDDDYYIVFKDSSM